MIEPAEREALRRILGEDCAREHEPRELQGLQFAMTLAPESGEELAESLRLLSDRGHSALIVGGGTRLDFGNLPTRGSVVLSLERLTGIEDLDPQDGVVKVRAGTPLATLREVSDPVGWEPGLEAPGATSTVGGAVASGAIGPRGLRFGAARDQVLGLSVTLASGTRTHCGGRVVKNVTGYDLVRLYTGSLGSLGVIESAWLRLRPKPESLRVFAVPLPGDDPCAAALAAAHRETARAALLLDGAWIRSAALDAGTSKDLLVVEFAGAQEAVDYDREWLGLAYEVQETPTTVTDTLRDLQGVRPGPDGMRLRISSLQSRVGDVRNALQRAGAEVLVDPGQGLVYAGFGLDREKGREGVDEILEAVRGAAALGKGPWLVEASPPWARAGVDVFGDPTHAERLFHALKTRFDPDGILNPGRFAGSL